jgi:hypothetical protein
VSVCSGARRVTRTSTTEATMRTRAIGIMAGVLAVILAVPAMAQQPPRDQPEQKTEELLDQLDEVRIQVELLEMEVAADKKVVQKMMEVLTEARLQRGDQPEERKADIVRLTGMLEEVRADFVKKSMELSRAKRRVSELEERRPKAAKVPTADRRIRAIERIISEILREVED